MKRTMLKQSRDGVFMISIGGTIAMTSSCEGEAISPALDGMGLLENLKGLPEDIQVQVESPYTIPSAHLTFRHLIDLASRVNEVAAVTPDAGIVITMGTDTLEEAAYFLDLTCRHANPVVITGAMRSPSQIGADGPRNLADAIVCAVSVECRDLGVVVVMNGEVHAAADVTKIHTTDISSFKSPLSGPLGLVQEERVTLFRKPWKHDRIEMVSCDEGVELIRSALGGDGRGMQVLLDAGASGFVIEGFGAGHVSPGMRKGIQAATAKGIPVVITSRCPAGMLLRNTYDYEGSEIDLQALGVYFADGLSGSKARIKLSLLLGNPKTRDRLSDYFVRFH